jgi:uncharacterized protein
MAREGIALITGASSGIGKTFAGFLAKRGYDLILVARRRELLQSIADELSSAHSVKAEVLTADLSSEEETIRVAQRIEADDALSMLVNSAGYGIWGDFSTSDIEAQLDNVRVHDLATMRLIRAALPGMIDRRRGAVINVASTSGFTPQPSACIYSGSKAFLILFTESLHLELLGSGVRFQVLCPGFTHTDFHAAAGMKTSGIPSWMWTDTDLVVEESLRALERDKVVVVPGWRNKYILVSCRLPRALQYPITARVFESFERKGWGIDQ